MEEDLFAFPVVPPSEKLERPQPRSARRFNGRFHSNESPANRPFAEWRRLATSGADISEVDSKTLSKLVRSFKRERDQKVLEGTNSESLDVVYQTVKSMHEERLKLDAQDERQTELFNRLTTAKSELSSLQETIAIQAHNIEAEISEQEAQLASKHQKEIDELAQEWESEPKLRLYNRPSRFLRSLRVQANLLLNDHRYDEMEAVVKQADAVEAKETKEHWVKQNQDYENALVVLQRRQMAEKKTLLRVHQQKRAEHEAAQQFDLRVLSHRIHNLEIEIEAASDAQKLWNLRHRFDAKILGKRPRAKQITGRRKFRVEDYNTLSLPPLVDLEPVERVSRKRRIRDHQRTVQEPKYMWL
jgi:hypothetical protein